MHLARSVLSGIIFVLLPVGMILDHLVARGEPTFGCDGTPVTTFTGRIVG
jgi:hypothetical protein